MLYEVGVVMIIGSGDTSSGSRRDAPHAEGCVGDEEKSDRARERKSEITTGYFFLALYCHEIFCKNFSFQKLESYSPSSSISNSDPLRKRSVSVPACPPSPAHLKRYSVLPSPALSEEENMEVWQCG